MTEPNPVHLVWRAYAFEQAASLHEMATNTCLFVIRLDSLCRSESETLRAHSASSASSGVTRTKRNQKSTRRVHFEPCILPSTLHTFKLVSYTSCSSPYQLIAASQQASHGPASQKGKGKKARVETREMLDSAFNSQEFDVGSESVRLTKTLACDF